MGAIGYFVGIRTDLEQRMSIKIDDSEFEGRVERLGLQQKPPLKKKPLVEAIVNEVIAACDISGDPEYWRRISERRPEEDQS